MKKIIMLIAIVFLLASCGMTQHEKLNKIEDCKELWYWYRLNAWDEIMCDIYKKDKVMECIREYTNWLDEKYNNPDHVSNLIEDWYSNVVKTCNDIFWDKETWIQ